MTMTNKINDTISKKATMSVSTPAKPQKPVLINSPKKAPVAPKYSRVNGKPISAPAKYQKAFQKGAPLPKGVKMAPKPKPNSYQGV